MPPRIPNFPAHASRDVWQDRWLSPRSSRIAGSAPGATPHDRTPALPRVARGGALASPADGSALVDERLRLGRGALSECLQAGAGAQGCSQHGARPRPPAPRAPAPRPAGPLPWRLFGRWIRCCSSAWGRPGPQSARLAPLLQPRSGLPARAHTRLLCRGRRAYELANHAVSARSRARGSSSTSRRGRSCAPHRASVECRAPQTFRHRVEWCGGAEPVESEHRAETRVYNTCFQTQLKTRERTERKALVLWPVADPRLETRRPNAGTVKCTHMDSS